ncbi:MAG: hypothetical protein KC656_01255 [Myxococcales bacterium]|nr:hypothetical protein [Myxococcales bacterium]MCB9670666.1 hypothetical protein [Alphaproteobacteria bacterium]MCB9693772.1 hypothetical protein [Alphaproteobacteria bacterium]
MLVVLPHGICVDPEIVKFFNIRTERPKGPGGPQVHTVVMKTDEEHLLIIGATEDRDEAEKLSTECARRINKALGAETEEADDDDADDDSEEVGDDDDDDDDDW